MIIVVGTFGGIIGGMFITLAWFSADILFGTHTLTGDRAAGVFGASVVGANLVLLGILAIGSIVHEWSNRR